MRMERCLQESMVERWSVLLKNCLGDSAVPSDAAGNDESFQNPLCFLKAIGEFVPGKLSLIGWNVAKCTENDSAKFAAGLSLVAQPRNVGPAYAGPLQERTAPTHGSVKRRCYEEPLRR